MKQSIYDAIGGAEAVDAAVDIFYDKVWGDPDLLPYFVGVHRRRLKGHQRAFLALALGGPEAYKGRPLDQGHAGRGITDDAFDRVVDYLVDTLSELRVPSETIEQIGAAVAPLREAVVDRSPTARRNQPAETI